MEKEIKDVVERIFQAIHDEEERENVGIIQEAAETLKQSKYDMRNPEMFNLFVGSKERAAMQALIKELHDPSECKDKYKPTFIFEMYSYLEQNIEKLCELKEKGGCSGDKSRYILSLYLDYAITGKVKNSPVKKGQFWKPKFGSVEDWMSLCDGLYRLHFGNPKDYLKSYEKLLQSQIVKFKYLKSEWYMEFEDGRTAHIGTTFDEKEFEPMQNEDNYIISKARVKSFKFEPYISGDDDEISLPRGFVSVPKSIVKRIYAETQEIYQ